MPRAQNRGLLVFAGSKEGAACCGRGGDAGGSCGGGRGQGEKKVDGADGAEVKGRLQRQSGQTSETLNGEETILLDDIFSPINIRLRAISRSSLTKHLPWF